MTTIKHIYINAMLADAVYVDSLAEGQRGQILEGYLTWDFAAVKAMLPATGTAGDDRIRGRDVREVIDGLGGNDVIEGQGGDNALMGCGWTLKSRHWRDGLPRWPKGLSAMNDDQLRIVA
ncbi:MAG: hypothetical protein ABIK82_07885 [Pseudomonadota bacterium]